MIVGIVGLGLTILLLMLPRTVVKNKEVSVNGDQIVSSTNEKEVAHVSKAVLENRLSLLDSLVEMGVPQQEIYLRLSSFFEANQVFDSAAIYLEKAAVNVEAYSRAGDLYLQAYNLALNPLTREDLGAKSREMFDKVLLESPRDLHSRTSKAMSLVTSASPMQAIQLLRQVLEDEPRYIPAIMSLGTLSMQSGQYDKAVLRFEDVLNIDPNNLRAKLGLAYSLLETGEKDKAVAIFNSVLKENIDAVLRKEVEETLRSIK